LVGAPARPGEIGEASTNTDEFIREFTVNALPKRKHVKDCLFSSIILKFKNELLFEIDTEDAAMQEQPSKRQAKRMSCTGGASGAESTTSGGEDDKSDSDDSDQDAAAAGGGARATLILVGVPSLSPPQQKKKAKAASPTAQHHQTQAFALLGTQCKCLMGHNMVVLATEIVSKTGYGWSAFQCSMCSDCIGSNTNSAKMMHAHWIVPGDATSAWAAFYVSLIRN
jgi:hypothetical protein